MKKNKIKPNTLKPLRHNIGIEKKYSKRLRAFSKMINNSCSYWLISKINKANHNEITNISKALETEFKRLLNFWNKKAEIFSERVTNSLMRDIIKHTDTHFKQQGFTFTSIPRNVKQSINSSILQNIALIKSIPSEIIEKYQNTLYNNINNFDLQALEKQIKSISKVTNNRAKLIARDQTGKALENYSQSRSQALGFEYYVWNTSRDERVSKGKGGHKQLDQRIYRYDTPTAIIDSYDNVGHCGARVNCRCIATPLVLDINQTLKKVKDLNGTYYIITDK